MRPAIQSAQKKKVAQASGIDRSSDSHFSLPHTTELDVRRLLLTQMNCHFHSLVVHRTRDGICLQGVVDGEPSDGEEICRIAATVSGVKSVINRLTFQHCVSEIPPKG
ncbi:MAG: BON domain-containing protein [Planctomycetaceae bacterium]|nr:BON domain-containing protein [Planctomycetaceae bacterium]